MQAVQSPVIPIVGEWVRSTPGAVSLGQGVVWWGPPAEAIDAAQRALNDPQIHRYKPVEGIPELVDAIEQKLARENGIRVRPESRVVVTSGGNMAFTNAVLAVASPGDEVILNTPYYFNHDMAIEMAGCKTVCVPTDAAYQLDLNAIAAAITPRTRAIVTVSPNNPSGAVYPESSLRAVNELCAKRGIFHIHDEAYDGFTYGVEHISPGSFSGAAEHTISLYSLSKSFGFAGWRIGYMVVPTKLFDAIKKIQDTNLICAAAISQYAALGALAAGRDYYAPKIRELGTVREAVRDELQSVSDLCEIPQPQGAFYFLLKVRTSIQPLALVERLVKEHKVAVLPGSAFFPAAQSGTCHLRLAYGALQKDGVLDGVRRFTRGLRAVLEGNES
jgi:aspartate/methionine/tyrosine aminotransferase